MCSQWILGVIETQFPKYQSIKDCYYHKVNNILSEFNQCAAIQKLSLLLVRRWMCRVRFIASCHVLRDKQAWEKNNKWMCCWKWSPWHTWWTGHKEHWNFSQWVDQVVKAKLVTNGFREKVLILSGRLICSTGRVVYYLIFPAHSQPYTTVLLQLLPNILWCSPIILTIIL